MRVVLDTNVILSGLLKSDTPPGQLLYAWREGRFVLVTSDARLAELRRALRYPKLKRRIPHHVAGALINRLRLRPVTVRPVRPPLDLPDEDDLRILGTALAAGADWLVTGDKSHLLTLKRLDQTRILAPEQAVQHLKRKRGR